MSAPPFPLPPPTATELAVVRARRDGREVLGRRGARRWRRIGAAAGALALLVGLVVALPVAWDSPGALSVSFAAVAAAVLAASVVQARTARRTDDRVRSRLAAAGLGSAPGRRAAGPAAWTTAGLSLFGASLAAYPAVHLVRHVPGPAAAAALLVPALLLGCVAVAVRTTLLATAVGAGPVLLAVDRALARRDLWRQLGGPTTLLCAGGLARSDAYFTHSGPSIWFDLATILLWPVAIGVGAGWSPSDRGLLADPRIDDATAPEAWLSGAPPLLEGSAA